MKPVLNLTIKRKWFDMIASGEKCEEYRDASNRQVARAYAADFNGKIMLPFLMILRAGYRMDSPALAVEVAGMDVRGANEIRHPEWGERRGEARIVIALGIVRVCGNYAQIKAWCEGMPGGWRTRGTSGTSGTGERTGASPASPASPARPSASPASPAPATR
ncbi:MAG: hypothetical protein IJ678_00685 [Kiritimatiellae bacterium]|nr:hypothetical protein [Kiritimatiellia bacterium]